MKDAQRKNAVIITEDLAWDILKLTIFNLFKYLDI